ncbi:MAG TPA: ABC transporter substrate-binding protein [candidate division Zixibacteria bacterium]|nr:ABC transporter substrate-binding protein [candidate division Zixibacteria bacterium]
MELTVAHYRNRFCMFRTYYALAAGKVRPPGLRIEVVEVPDPPSRALEEALIRGDVHVANLYVANFLRRKLEGAPIVGLATEWKSTLKGNGVFVRRDGPIRKPQDLAGALIATHQGPHAIHRYLLRRAWGVDDATLRWEARPQEELLEALRSGRVDAVVLLDQFFFRGESAPDVRCLYTDGEAWMRLTGFEQMIKHMVAVREEWLARHPESKESVLRAFRDSFAYSERHLEEIGEAFVRRYGGDRDALLASARYPRIEFTWTDEEQQIFQAEMEMLVATGAIPRSVPIASLFAA